MTFTDEMEIRQSLVGGRWIDEGDGYASLVGIGPLGMALAYIALSLDHPNCGNDYEELEPDVNGGLTSGKSHIFGWDYGHYQNRSNLVQDRINALEYFRRRQFPLLSNGAI